MYTFNSFSRNVKSTYICVRYFCSVNSIVKCTTCYTRHILVSVFSITVFFNSKVLTKIIKYEIAHLFAFCILSFVGVDHDLPIHLVSKVYVSNKTYLVFTLSTLLHDKYTLLWVFLFLNIWPSFSWGRISTIYIHVVQKWRMIISQYFTTFYWRYTIIRWHWMRTTYHGRKSHNW